MNTVGSSTDEMFAQLERLRRVWPKKGWSWDYRFNCAASSFHVDLTDECEAALDTIFPDRYDHRTISRAPEAISEIAEAVGGVRSDQRFYSLKTTGRIIPYAMWWPWGDEITISLRVGLAGYVGDSDTQRMQIDFQAVS